MSGGGALGGFCAVIWQVVRANSHATSDQRRRELAAEILLKIRCHYAVAAWLMSRNGGVIFAHLRIAFLMANLQNLRR